MTTQNENAAAEEEVELGGETLHKAALAEALYRNLNIDRRSGKVLVEQFFELIIEQLKQGKAVKLPGLGNFSVRDKHSRPGRNLQTGETVMINARRVVNFHPSGTLNVRVSENLIQEAGKKKKK